MDYKKEIAKLIKIEGVSKEEIESLIVFPKDSAMGDYALPCFKFSKMLRKSPVMIADELKSKVELNDVITKVESVAGYLNFTINKKDFIVKTLNNVSETGENYGRSDLGKGKTVCIDYSSINIAKPFHIGHLSTTVIGAALYRIYKFLGYNTVGINHLGDWGTQFGKLIVAYKLWGDKKKIEENGIKALLEIYVKFHDEAEKNDALNDEARAWFKKIEDGNEEALELFNWFKAITLKEVQRVYDRLDVTFDSYNGESFYNDKMEPVLDEIEEKGLAKISEGATIVDLEEYGMPPCLLKKADGATLYATRDLAAAFYRKKTYDFDKCLYVVAYQQNLHFKQWFKVVELMGYPWAKDLIHVAFGMVSLEGSSLSTRKGNVVFLEEVLDNAVKKAYDIICDKNNDLQNKEEIAEEVGVGAVVFSALSNNRIKDISFSYDKVLNFDGETAPYVQYTHARCCSVLEKCEITSEIDYEGVNNPEAFELCKLLDRYPDIIKDASEKYEPSMVTRQIIDISQAYNKFYINHRIIDQPEGIRNARLLLTKAVKDVIKSGLGLIGIKAPSKM